MYKQKWFGRLIQVLDACLSIALPVLMLVAAAVGSGALGGRPLVAETPTADETSAEAVTLLQSEMKAMGWGDCLVQQVDSVTWQVVENEGGTARAQWISSQKIATDVQGFAGATPVCLMLSPEGKILKVVSQEHAETKDYFDEAWQHILPQCEGKTLAELDAEKIDGMTGATYTSQSLIKNINAVKTHWSQAEQGAVGQWYFGWKHAALLLTLLVGGVVAWMKRKAPWMRIIVLALNVGVVGVWTGSYLSLSQLLGWMEHGWVLAMAYPAILVLSVSLLMPLLGKRKYYCNWICPYGSAQELLGKLPVPKVEISKRGAEWMTWIRRVCFGTLFVLLWMGVGRDVLGYEPFSLFQPQAAAPAVLIISGVILLSSLFVHRPWCRCFCPLGELMDMANPSVRSKGKVSQCETKVKEDQDGK
jgi:Na+-translocating ferredoxin:NAD+ oxidoreductase RnfG subunit